MIDPVSGVGLFNAVSTALKTVAELRKNMKSKDDEEKLAALYDTLWELKTAVAALEDENHSLKDQLRFTSDRYEFRLPFWYEKGKDHPLCPRCFGKEKPIPAPMSEQMRNEGGRSFRRCLVCRQVTEEPAR
jgi:hypothetical protein